MKVIDLMSLVKKRIKGLRKRRSKPPILTPYANRRSREHLVRDEAEAVIAAAGSEGRHAHRNATLIRLMYRHALRVGEVVKLRWEQLNLEEKVIHLSRLKKGKGTDQPLYDADIEDLKGLRNIQKDVPASGFVFVSSTGRPISPDAVRKFVRKAGEKAGLPFPIHPHMFRHSAGYFLASNSTDTRIIQEYLGHAYIQNTTRYTFISPERFKGLWDK